ncbi:MAG: ATP-dependent zinc metalloprotease FtsH [Clostridia bacterium]|nr:ATP-dependent zinc metalloprotease FtsH [Clostridia bacterium]
MSSNENKKNGKSNKKGNRGKITLIALIIVAMVAAIVYGVVQYSKSQKEKEEKTLAYTKLVTDMQEDKVEKIEMKTKSDTVKIKIKDDEKEYEAIVPESEAFIEFVQEQIKEGKTIELVQKEESPLLAVGEKILSLLPTLLLIVFVILLFQMQGLGEKGKVYDATTAKTKTTFKDIAGLDEERQEMVEIVDFLKKPKKFQEMGAKVPRGVLLCGNPGTGKTLIAKAIAGEADVPFISMSGSEFIEMFAGLGASRVRKLFEKARKIAPCIVFIDEIDAIGSRRTTSSGAESENNQTLNQLLVEMDGFDTEEAIIVLAATNRPEMLDKALLRPGRFDRQIMIGLPDLNGREEILKIHAKNKKISSNVNLRSIAEDTAGFTGAELANILNEAAIIATIKSHDAITNRDIEDAVKKVTVGIEKHSRVVSDKDKRLTAFHEAGHAIVSRYLETQKDIKEVSIIPRGVAGGYTMYKTNEDKFYVSKQEMLEKLIALLGGRAAEKIALDDISTGASNDIEVATQIATDMVTIYGMSDIVGPIYVNAEKDPYQMQLLGEKFEDSVGSEIKLLIDNAYYQAKKLVSEHMDKLELVANALMEKEIISAEEFESFFEE